VGEVSGEIPAWKADRAVADLAERYGIVASVARVIDALKARAPSA
jgi:hypothetical protein